ncbi:MAG: NADH-quinone oxidoreductase subunit C, partial [Pyrinomonadaceae bacterium]|nr:NADH-quinone oxidoreductase subunit C [Pyrinomonadaceae bacterium]
MVDTTVLHEYIEKLKAENPVWVADLKDTYGEVTITVPRESIVDVCWVLKTKYDFNMLADLCGADRGPEEDPRFEVNYHLFSTKHFNRLRLKVLLSDDEPN